MWFNSMIREEPYPGLKREWNAPETVQPTGRFRGAAWLSSARAVRCRLKCHNERNPRRQLLTGNAEDSAGLPPQGVRKAGMTSNQHYLTSGGRHTCYNGRYSGKPGGDAERNPKAVLSSDRSLQPDSVKLDSLVIAHQPWRGEYVPGLVHTARQAMGAGGA